MSTNRAKVDTIKTTVNNSVEKYTTQITVGLECPECHETLTEVSFTFDQISEVRKGAHTCLHPVCVGADLVLQGTDTPFGDFLDTLDTERKFAAVCWLISQQEDFDTLEETAWQDNGFECGGVEFMLLTDNEADYAFWEYMENYVDECVLDSIAPQYRCYFDVDQLIEDVQTSDGRGPTLATEDGEEREIKVSETYWYAYRIG